MGEAVTRREVVQAFLDLHPSPSYLEIGVRDGETFAPLRAARKVAVDPAFVPGTVDRLRQEAEAQVDEITSDAYFGSEVGGDRFDVIYLDGLHRSEQTLRDLLNAIAVLKPSGVVVIDDVVPDSYAASLPDEARAGQLRQRMPTANGNWMGDVYRVVYFVESFLQPFRYRTVADNHGQLVLWRGRRARVPDRSLEWVARAGWEDIVIDAPVLRRMPLAGIVDEVARQFRLGPHAA